MILGLDHLAINVTDLDGAKAALQRIGYTLEFHEAQLLNHPQKESFLRQMCQTHSIALLKPERAGMVAIELTQHATAHPTTHPGLLPWWSTHELAGADLGSADPSSADPKSTDPKSTDHAFVHWHPERTPSYLTRSEDSVTGIQRVCVLSDQIEAETEFWLKAIGMKLVDASDASAASQYSDFQLLKRSSPIPAWSFEIQLQAAAQVSRGYLDDQAATCLALLVTDAQRDLDKLLAAGGQQASEVFLLTVNEQPLRIALLRSPSGHCVELIEQPKRAR